MNDKEDSMELLEWDKKNIIQFAQYLYDLAKERVQVDRAVTSEEIVDEVTEEPVLESEILEEETTTEIDEEVEEVLDEPELEVLEEVTEVEPEVEPEAEAEEIVDELEEEIHLDKELQKVTIGLAKAVSGEEVGVIDDSDQEEIQEIIEKEQIPLPSESKDIEIESVEEAVVASEIIESVVHTEPQEVIEDQISGLDAVDLSAPIVKEPVISEEVLIQPENIPEDIHNLVFVEEATSVPITKDEIIITTTDEDTDDLPEDDSGHDSLLAPVLATEVHGEITVEPVAVLDSEREGTESMLDDNSVEHIHEEIVTEVDIPQEVTSEVVPELVHEEMITEVIPEEPPIEVPEEIPEEVPEVIPEVVPEVISEETQEADGLDTETTQRRQSIIEQMLADTKKREEQEGFKVRDLGETAGRAYSAVVFGNESNKNVKKWKKWEKKRLRQEKKKKK